MPKENIKATQSECVFCGEYVPEGRHVCPACERSYNDRTPTRIKNTDPRIKGLISKRAGDIFEEIIAASLLWYESKMLACIEKTPEPTKQLNKPDQWGRFRACYTKKAQPDFKGTLANGRSVVFEAKHTDDDRIKWERVTKEQRDRLALHHNLGAVAFVLVSFGLQDFYRIPWKVWRDMKAIYGRKYILKTEAERYKVPFENGVIKLLDAEEKEREIRESRPNPIRLKGGGT